MQFTYAAQNAYSMIKELKTLQSESTSSSTSFQNLVQKSVHGTSPIQSL